MPDRSHRHLFDPRGVCDGGQWGPLEPGCGLDIREVLRLDTPWPLIEVLAQLLKSWDHYSLREGGDRHGYELDSQAADAALGVILALNGGQLPEELLASENRRAALYELALREDQLPKVRTIRGAADVFRQL